MKIARQQHAAALIAGCNCAEEGDVLITGGRNIDNNNGLNSAELYNPTTQQFTSVGKMNKFRFLHTATAFANGNVLIAGGDNNETAEIYCLSVGGVCTNSSLGTFVPLHNNTIDCGLPSDNCSTGAANAAVPLLDARDRGEILVSGGSGPPSPTLGFRDSNTIASLFSSDGSFMSTAPLQVPLVGHTATAFSDGTVLIAGGQNASAAGFSISNTELFDPTSRTFSPGPSDVLPYGRYLHTATPLNGGSQVLVTGGATGVAGGLIATNSAELYDTSGGVYLPLESMNQAREGGTATLLTDGTALIAGGSNMIDPNGTPKNALLSTPVEF
jgi:hypothetical protein